MTEERKVEVTIEEPEPEVKVEVNVEPADDPESKEGDPE